MRKSKRDFSITKKKQQLLTTTDMEGLNNIIRKELHFSFVFNNNNMTEKAVSQAQFNIQKEVKEKLLKEKDDKNFSE